MIERCAVRGGLPGLGRRALAGRTLILAYHNVVPRGERPAGDASLHLPQDRFAAQLDALLETHEVVPLAAVLEPDGRPPRRPRAVITFDDAYRGSLTAGLAELAARGLPATFFVAPAYVPDGAFWWDALAAAGPVRETALEALAGRQRAILDWAAARGVRAAAVPPHATAASEAELRAATAHPGITLGSHSWSHPNLARLPADELRAELRRPLEWLRARFAAVVPWLAYPYGLASPSVARLAAEAGYAGALRIDGGWVPAALGDRFRVPRLNIPAGVSPEGFVLRAAGLVRR
ncbi:MAG TPA: polysaccharide deacetylase family protein [Longimicrobiales bacterium]|nr:polysaccharide deacetylase family protein [Longimicrobiales bacterium]